MWLFYGYISSQLTFLRFRRDGARLHDPPALAASPGTRDLCPNPETFLTGHSRDIGDLIKIASSVPKIIQGILPSFVPYFVDASLFALFIKWNGGIVLGQWFARSYLEDLS